LTFALVFGVFVAWWTIAEIIDLELPTVGWFVAGGLILFGLLGLVGALRSGRSEPGPRSVPEATVSAVPGNDDPTEVVPPDQMRP
jgi:hypothetical protein